MKWVILAAGFSLVACSQAAPAADTGPEARIEGTDAALQLADAPPAQPAASPSGPAPEPAVGTSAQPGPAVQPVRQQPDAGRDSRLIGTWVNEDIMNSPGGAGGFASFTTIMTMEFHPDGRIIQYTESYGGGGDWSYGGERTLDFEGQWRADGRTLSVYGMGLPDFTPAAIYEFSGDYLVTNNDQGRLIWQRSR